jgi:hypothetical protein
MRTALRLYYNDNGSYPASNYFASLWGQQWKVGSAVYINTLPKDPLSPTQDYQYKIGTLSDSPAYSSTDSFTLVACLENLSDTSGVTTPSQFSCPNSEKAFVVSQ